MRLLKLLARLLLGLILLLVLGLLVVGAAPLAGDPAVAPADYGAGARSVEPSLSGLQREFPPLNEPADNPSTPAKAELGRLLFFDPLLSAGNDIACATCHHPDLGFADGRPLAAGAGGEGLGPARVGGVSLARHTPSLWNVGYASSLFWDGRAASLEEQALVPLAHPDEMGAADTAALVAELRAIPEYVALFEAAFGPRSEPVSLENSQRALAAFERSLISRDSPFDRYAAGDFEALTNSQRRGLAVYRSAATRCFECHQAPTFASDTFRVSGVPAAPGAPADPGRAAVANDAPAGAFKVPSLRNVALTAPYMHNGAFASLEEVIAFYAQGGGRPHGAANVDSFVQGFTLSDQERADLIAFLLALSDESQLPPVPEQVPSGLPVVSRLDSPARAIVAQTNLPPGPAAAPGRPARTIRLLAGESIQSAVDRARPGDTVEVPFGVYSERVVVDMSDISVLGLPNAAGEWPLLDGGGRLTEGVIASGNNIRIGRFRLRDYTENGILVEGARGVHLHDIRADNTGIYGVYPVQSSDVLIERLAVSGVADAGIYAGQCENVVVRDSQATGNVIGIELENTVAGEVYNNEVSGNTVGIFIVVLPNLTSKVSLDTRVYANRALANNLDNFAPAEATAALLPPGLGILLLGADEAEVYANTVEDNRSAGIGVYSLLSTGAFEALDVGPNPERNWLHDNRFDHNGYDPAPAVAELGVPTGDILWDGSGVGNRFDEPDAQGNFPPLLPGDGWPAVGQRAYSRALQTLIRLAR
ncbi:MAG: parallel beta-helix domain-containing protein [Candidatus Promineifilaceae bacterium]